MSYKTPKEEVWYAFTHPYQWFLLAWYDIRQRYRRSILGPFWITISTAVLIGTLGFLWSTLFKTNIETYLPYFAVGNILWVMISAQINESTTGFSQFEHIVKQHRLPYPSYILRLLSRNFIIFLHNTVIIFVVVFFSANGWTLVALLALPGFLVILISLFFISFSTAILCVRYRDLAPIVQNIVTVAYFLSPIMWQATSLPDNYQWVVSLNPLSYFLDIVRKPLLGEVPTLLDWGIALLLMAVLMLGSFYIFSKTRDRIAYWL